MKRFLSKKKVFLKDRIINEFLKSGKKTTSEKILLRFAKFFQKANKKNFISLLQFSVINTTPIFSVNTQIIKKGKRKTIREIPLFLCNHSIRISKSLKLLKEFSIKEKKTSHFYKIFGHEALKSATRSSTSVTKKIELQKQVLSNKRYWYNFRW